MAEHFGHWHVNLWTPGGAVNISCAAESAGRELPEGLSRLVCTYGFPLEAS